MSDDLLFEDGESFLQEDGSGNLASESLHAEPTVTLVGTASLLVANRLQATGSMAITGSALLVGTASIKLRGYWPTYEPKKITKKDIKRKKREERNRRRQEKEIAARLQAEIGRVLVGKAPVVEETVAKIMNNQLSQDAGMFTLKNAIAESRLIPMTRHQHEIDAERLQMVDEEESVLLLLMAA